MLAGGGGGLPWRSRLRAGPGGLTDGSDAEGGAVAWPALDYGGQRLARCTLEQGDHEGAAHERGLDGHRGPRPIAGRG